MDISISYDNLFAHVEPNPLPQEVSDIIYHSTKYRPDGYQHIWSFKSKKWDGFNYLYNPKEQVFRRGLLARVVKALEDYGHNVHTEYTTTGCTLVSHKFNKELIRPYEFQRKVINAVEFDPMGLIVSPTGTGKTVMISLAISALCRNTMVLVTDVVLLDQMQQALQRLFDQPIGIIGDGEFDLQSITVSTVQSLASIKKAKSIIAADKRKLLVEHLKTVGAVISDEVHLYDTSSVADVMTLFPNADRFYGMSATPYGWAEKTEKRSNIELEQHFGKVIYDTRKANNFRDLGLKVPIYVQSVQHKAINSLYNKHVKWDRFRREEVPDYTANYKDALDTEILDNFDYHIDVAKQATNLIAAGNTVFVHAAHSIEFGTSIAKLIPGAVLVNGSTPRLERRRIYDAMRKRDIVCLVSDVGGTGLDIPNLNALILASDVTDIRQLKGRVERASSGKDFGLLVDMNIDTSFLKKHYETRCGQYKHDGHIILSSS